MIVDLHNRKTLTLNVKHKWFEVMATGEKAFEIRDKSNWMNSRLFNKDGTKKHYNFIKIVSGYGSSRPNFIAKFEYFHNCAGMKRVFSNGAVLDFEDHKWIIHFGNILELNNYEINPKTLN